MEKKNIAVTIRSFGADHSTLDTLRSHFTISFMNETGRRLIEEELIAAIRNAHGVIAGTEQFTAKVIRNSPELRVISRVGVGTDSIDFETARASGISVLNTPVAPSFAVAEHTLGLILCCIKHICRNAAAMRTENHSLLTGLMLKGRTCGIIGMGRIGQKVGALLAAFGCRVMYFDPYCAQVPDSRFIKVESLDTLLSESDIITLHTPAIEDQEPIIRRRTLMVCKKGVVIINTARGSLIDEESLLEALKERRVYAAGLDVFRSEPYSGALLACPQVVATPHVASNTVESRKEMEMEAVNNLIMAFGQGIA